MKYIDTAIGGASKRNHIKALNEPLELFEPDCYTTYFQFSEGLRDYVLKYGTVKNYTGSYTSDFLPFDIDDDLDKAREKAIRLGFKLQAVYGLDNDDLRLFFTGAKGFHIEIPQEVFGGFEESNNLAYKFKQVAKAIAKDVEIDTAIYDKMRLWRVTNTVNSKTGLYKIPLSSMPSLEEIKQLAKIPQPEIKSKPKFNKRLADLYSNIKVSFPPKITILQGEKSCIHKIINSKITEGERNNTLLRLAVYFNKRYPAMLVAPMLKQWAINQGLEEDEINTTIQSAQTGYDYGCNDEILSKYCGNDCTYSRKKNNFNGKYLSE